MKLCSFDDELYGLIKLTFLQVSNEPGMQYNVSLMNALVLYVGTQAIAYIHSKGSTPSTSTIAHTASSSTWWSTWTLRVSALGPQCISPHLGLSLLLSHTHSLSLSGQYLFLNAIANQLRYPNSHTHYFSCALLSLFAETNAEAIQEQITR